MQIRGTAEQRFEARVIRGDECWEWNGAHTDGYGVLWIGDGKTALAHRWSYEHFVGPIPEGLEIDHLCRNRGCCNPAHLEPVTHAENGRRGVAGPVSSARQRAKTRCPRKHEYSEENTLVYLNKKTGSTYRICKECLRLRNAGLTNGWADHRKK